MTNYCGDFRPSDTVRIPFTTVNPGGVPSQLSGAPALAVYAMGSVMSAMVAGVSVIVNMGSFTGQNVAVIDTSQDTIAYAQGVDFAVTITSGYAGSLSSSILVGYTIGHFSINNRSLRNTTSIAQLGVNVVTIGDATARSSLAAGNVNVVTVGGVAPATSAVAGNVNVVSIAGLGAVSSLALGGVNVNQILGVGVVTSSAMVGVNIVTWEGDAPNRLVAGKVDANATATVSGVVQANIVQINGAAAVSSLAQLGVNVITVADAAAVSSLASGNVNVVTIAGLTPATSAVAGNVNVVSIQGVAAATSLASGGVNVNQIRGSGAVSSLALGNVNVVTVGGATPASSAIGGNVNVVSVQGLGAASSLALGNVNVVQIAQAAVTLDANNLLKVDVEDIAGNAVNVNIAQLGVNAVNIAGVVAATSLAIGNATVAKFTPGVITTGAFTAGALATTVFPTGVFIASLFDATANNAIADALLDRVNGVETGVTPRQSWRGVGASAFGALSGAGTGNVGIWGGGVSSTTRLSAVTDQSGNRLSVTVNL